MAMSKWVSVLIIAAILVGTAVPLSKLYGSKGGGSGSGNDDTATSTGDTASLALPAFAKTNAKTRRAYELASTTRKEQFKFLTCHCGCGMHAMQHRGKTIPKMNNLGDCFVRPDGTWEDHAAMDCPYCVDLAIMADDMLTKGSSLKEIRKLIDTKYNQLSPSDRAMDMNPPMPTA